MNLLVAVVGIAGMFLLLIGPHEFGHFIFAKLFKVRVIEFSIGAGVRLWSVTRGGTLYALRAIPVLGYVRMGGMEAGDFADPNGFHTKPAWQRLVILAAGPAANFLVAILLITAYDLTQLNDVPGKVVGVLPNSPAAAAGIQVGDRLQTVDGRAITGSDQLRGIENNAPNAAIVLGGKHANGRPFAAIVTPKCTVGDKGQTTCQVGITARWSVVTVQDALTNGVTFPYNAVKNIFQGLVELVTGKVPGGLLGPNGFTGPIGIADVAYQSVSLGLETYIPIVALLSVALGFTNLLPFLALDGGRMVVVLVEVVRRRPFDRTMELNVQRAGLVALLALAAVISFLDIQRIASGEFPGLTR
jgi:regulator of sigma E protease